MKRKNGFVAISLLYSFFIVFIAVMMTLLVNFAHNRVLLKNINDDISVDLFSTKQYGVDISGANSPDLSEDLIPIYFEDGKPKKANASNVVGNGQWYNYSQRRWANAVTLKSPKTYNVGQEIPSVNIKSTYVWIPRYKYILFNNGSTTIEPIRLTVQFEQGDISTGADVSNDESPKEGYFYTHPAFTLQDDCGNNVQLKGFWVEKKLNSNAATTIANNFNSARGNSVSNLTSSMITNTQYAAVLYLAHSKYGILGDTTLAEGERALNGNSSGNDYGVLELNTSNQQVMGLYNVQKTVGTSRNSTALNNSFGLDLFCIDSMYYDNYSTNSTGVVGAALGETLSWDGANGTMINSTNPIMVRGNNGHPFSFTSTNKSSTGKMRGVLYKYDKTCAHDEVGC